MITNEALMVLENNLVFSQLVNRQLDDRFGVAGAKIGDTINVRKPPNYVGRTTEALATEDITETNVPVSLDKIAGVDITFGMNDLLLHMDDFSARYLHPAMARIANMIDEAGAALIPQLRNIVGDPGTLPNDIDTYLDANAQLDSIAAPMDEYRSCVVTPHMNTALVHGQKGLFHAARELERQYSRGYVGQVSGLDFFRSQNLPLHTYGVGGNTANNAERAQMRSAFAQPTSTTDAFDTESEIQLDGFANSTNNVVRAGDILTIAGVFEINPQSYKSTGELKQFRVKEAANSNGTGQADVTVEPAIVWSATPTTNNHPHENDWTCIGLPANDAIVTIIGAGTSGSRKQGVVMHKDAFCLVTAPQPLPTGVDFAAYTPDSRLGVKFRLVRQYDINTNRMPTRFDALYGWSMLRPELGVRVAA